MAITTNNVGIPKCSAKKPVIGKIKPTIPHEKPPINPEISPLCCGTAFCAMTMFTGIAISAKNPIKTNAINESHAIF